MSGARRTSTHRVSGGFESSSRRRSTLLTTPATNRRQSLFSNVIAPASSQSATHLSQQQHRNPPAKVIDLRPLNDKAYLEMLMGEIYDFLVANRFELEMNHAVSRRTLQSPTQKEFVLMFQFLYRKIDPHFVFTKSLETDVIQVLRAWEYPYTEHLSRTHISSVGQSWPKFLAMLYWLMKLNLALSGLTEDDMIASDDPFDRLFIRYTHQCYGAYIDQQEDYSGYYKELETEFDQINAKTVEEQETRTQRLQELLQQREELKGKVAELDEAHAKSRALENDLRQFSDYMDKMSERKEKWGDVLQKMEEELEKLQHQISELQEEKKKYEDQLTAKGLSASEIDQSNIERDRLSKAIDKTTNKLKDTQQNIADQEYQLRSSCDSLVNLVSQYNYLTSRIPVQEYSFELAVNPDLAQTNQEINSDNVLTKTLRDEKVKLLQCRSALTQELRKKQEEKLKLQEEVDQLHVKIFEQNEFLDGIKAKCRKTMQLYSEAYDFMMTDSKTYSAKIEKLDRDLQTLRLRVNTGIIEAESTIKSLRVKKQETEYRIKEERESLHRMVSTIIDQVLDFKYAIQEGLDELDTLAFQELEAQDD
ncbi:hypothetical protein FT663_04089 [Candidozyma haemuli var. vulneris]|uniref:Kinetochore protein NDC80 n=1 Tax=Candidozyma haemuli TaxID=45357 RepID=A0A2V1AVU7_9ASCO|nr:hypothetical protein CXQ85_004576 [[Candida] haemuloni]KAF3988333.1 hypothetical protein FT663_04089 [[Candida] haemuloni var. vulneris]KAF3988415.1 hypothetical protein FT662_03448 [[Candida] haemuloni var. vulneris]PVH21912.1 hypothetical protein CXQ85_004576 [[Candida] haemuloni]